MDTQITTTTTNSYGDVDGEVNLPGRCHLPSTGIPLPAESDQTSFERKMPFHRLPFNLNFQSGSSPAGEVVSVAGAGDEGALVVDNHFILFSQFSLIKVSLLFLHV